MNDSHTHHRHKTIIDGVKLKLKKSHNSEGELSMADLRSKLLGAKANFKTEEVEYEGDKYIVREMSLRQRRKLIENCSLSKKQPDGTFKNELDGTLFQVYSIIACVEDERGKKVFESSDADAMLELPATSGFVGVFSEAITKLVGTEEETDTKNE